MKVSSPEILRETMRTRGASTAALAARAACSKSMIGHLLSGHKASCSDDLAARIAESLGVPADLLFVPDASTPGRDFANGKAAS